ncbi:hypothetical protein Tco_1400562 [Tanacetum coccineum]
MPITSCETKTNKTLRRTARISVKPCCLVNPKSPNNLPPFQRFSPPSDYHVALPSTPLDSPPTKPLAPPGFSPTYILTTLKTTPPLTTLPSAPTQASKKSSPLTINLEPIELIFSTPPTSPHHLFDSVDDLPLRTTNPPPPQPTFESIERIANQPPPILDIMDMEPLLPPLPSHLSLLSQPMWSNIILAPLPYETFCEHYQCIQVIVHELRDEMRFVLVLRIFVIQADTWIVPDHHAVKRVVELKLAPTVARTSKNVATFKQTLKEEMVKDLIHFNSLVKEVESLQSQLELQRTQF